MISLCNNVTVEMGISYFEKDDYYSREGGPAETKFFGKGAEMLGLTRKKFDPLVFRNLLGGYSPDGLQQITKSRQKKLSKEHFTKVRKTLRKSIPKEKLSDPAIKEILSKFDRANKGFHLDIRQKQDLKQLLFQRVAAMPENASIKGKLKKSINLAVNKISQEHRRPAYDVTFSAPKSVSLAVLLGDDKKLLEAHTKAVDYALRKIEERCIGALVGPKDNRQFVKTGNLIAAKFTHGTSREQDPQLHTHCVIMNRTLRGDGEWRAIVNEEIWRQQKLLGALYQNKLAELAQKLGYGIEVHKEGTFDLKGYDPKVLQHFSKRRKQVVHEGARMLFERDLRIGIESKSLEFEERTKAGKTVFLTNLSVRMAQKLGFSTQKVAGKVAIVDFIGPKSFDSRLDHYKSLVGKELANEAVLRNREYKGEVDYLKIKEKWQSEASDLGLTHPEQDLSRSDLELGKPVDLNFTESHLRERSATFTANSVEFQTVARNLGRTSFERISKKIETDGIIIRTDMEKMPHDSPKSRRTSLKQLALEAENLKFLSLSNGRYEPLMSEVDMTHITDRYGFNKGQLDAVASVLTSRDRIMGWEGVAGSGKSYACQAIREYASKRGVIVKGFGPDASSAQAFQNESGIRSMTIHRHLVSQPQESKKPQLWIVDEASKLSTELMNQFLVRARSEDARILFMGDPKRQLGAVGAGSPFLQFINSGKMLVSVLDEHRRQKNDKIKDAVVSASLMTPEGLKGSVEKISDHIIEGKRRVTRIASVIKSYMSLPKDERSKTLILADLNEDRLSLTSQLRTELKATGELGPDDVSLKVLKDKQLSTAQRSLARYYDQGDVLVPTKDHENLVKGAKYQITKVNKSKDLISLELDGKKVEVPTKDLSVNVFREKQISVTSGDILRWRKNHLGHINNQTLSVVEATSSQITLYDAESKETIRLDPNESQYLDYGLVMTTYSSQGHTRDKGILLAESNISMNSWYTALSRFRHGIKVITDDKSKLESRIMRSGLKENALDQMTAPDGWDIKLQQYTDKLGIPMKVAA